MTKVEFSNEIDSFSMFESMRHYRWQKAEINRLLLRRLLDNKILLEHFQLVEESKNTRQKPFSFCTREWQLSKIYFTIQPIYHLSVPTSLLKILKYKFLKPNCCKMQNFSLSFLLTCSNHTRLFWTWSTPKASTMH